MNNVITRAVMLEESQRRNWNPLPLSRGPSVPAVAAGAAKPRREQAGEGEARVLARAITCISPAFARRRRIAVLLSTGESPTPSYNRPPVLCLLFTGRAKENCAIYPPLATRRPSGVSLQISKSGLSGLKDPGPAQPRRTQDLTVRGLATLPLPPNRANRPP